MTLVLNRHLDGGGNSHVGFEKPCLPERPHRAAMGRGGPEARSPPEAGGVSVDCPLGETARLGLAPERTDLRGHYGPRAEWCEIRSAPEPPERP